MLTFVVELLKVPWQADQIGPCHRPPVVVDLVLKPPCYFAHVVPMTNWGCPIATLAWSSMASLPSICHRSSRQRCLVARCCKQQHPVIHSIGWFGYVWVKLTFGLLHGVLPHGFRLVTSRILYWDPRPNICRQFIHFLWNKPPMFGA